MIDVWYKLSMTDMRELRNENYSAGIKAERERIIKLLEEKSSCAECYELEIICDCYDPLSLVQIIALIKGETE